MGGGGGGMTKFYIKYLLTLVTLGEKEHFSQKVKLTTLSVIRYLSIPPFPQNVPKVPSWCCQQPPLQLSPWSRSLCLQPAFPALRHHAATHPVECLQQCHVQLRLCTSVCHWEAVANRGQTYWNTLCHVGQLVFSRRRKTVLWFLGFSLLIRQPPLSFLFSFFPLLS